MKGKKGQAHYYGIASCMELIKRRPDEIIRAYFASEHKGLLKPLLAKTGKPYKIVPQDELKKLTDSVHHEGVCLVAKKMEPLHYKDVENLDGPALFLDGVMNPHNLGALMRTAAHFGLSYLFVPEGTTLPPAAYRIARGGADHIPLVISNYQSLKRLKKEGYTLYATSPHKGDNLHQVKFPKKSLIILGSESDGISKEAANLADEMVTIPGTGHIESLNVSAAFAIIASRLSC